MNDKSDDELIGYLEEQGAVVWEGMDEDGEAIFKFDLDRLKEVMPDLHADILADIDSDLMILYENGLIEMEYDEELNAQFRITEKGQKAIEEMNFPPFLN